MIILSFTMFTMLNSVYAESFTENNTDIEGSISDDSYEFFINEEYDYSNNDEYDVEKDDNINVNGFFTDEINIKDTNEISVDNSDTIDLIDEDSNLFNAIKTIEDKESYYINFNDNIRKIVLQKAFSQIGIPYIWGSSNPGFSFDCFSR